MDINFEKTGGLAPAIIQDETSGEVLMLGFMNAESFEMTQAERRSGLLFSLPKQALEKGRVQRTRAEGVRYSGGLRRRCAADSGESSGAGSLP